MAACPPSLGARLIYRDAAGVYWYGKAESAVVAGKISLGYNTEASPTIHLTNVDHVAGPPNGKWCCTSEMQVGANPHF
jgi:hypothetical protein